MRSFLLITFVLAIAFVKTNAQTPSGAIEGIIKNEQGEPLPGINVGLKGTTLGAPTDANGFYAIRNVPPGHYTLAATGVGFREQTKRSTFQLKKY